MSTLLIAGADIILANGFVPNRYYQDKLDATGWRPARKCPVCPRGGIAIAAGHEPDFMVMLDKRGLTAPESDPIAYAKISDAEQRLARYLIAEQDAEAAATDGEVIENWADDPRRTQPQVIGAMRAAHEYTGRPA